MQLTDKEIKLMIKDADTEGKKYVTFHDFALAVKQPNNRNSIRNSVKLPLIPIAAIRE
jgi:Ca2+-binding EF-hand superfamily protein